MDQAWVARVGQANRRAAVFERPGAIALGWAEVPGIGDLAAADEDALAERLRATGRDDAEEQASQLIAFRDDLTAGDLLVAVDARTGDVLLGSVAGEYAYQPEDARGGEYYPHRRAVSWRGRIREAEIPDVLGPSTRSPRTLQPAGEDGAEWARLAEVAEAAEAAVSAPAKKARAPRAAKAPRAPRAPAAPKKPKKPEPQPDRRCVSCGYSWPASQFDGGDLCVECRS
jgi:predicted Mrr-cat superfamily restriction endonuclease